MPLQCPPLEISSPHLQVLSLNNSYLGTATFSCPLGFTLQPQLSSIWCGLGVWSAPVPSCHLITCPAPAPPLHATTVVSGNRVGDTATTTCKDGFRLVGSEVSRLVREEGEGDGELSVDYPPGALRPPPGVSPRHSVRSPAASRALRTTRTSLR